MKADFILLFLKVLALPLMGVVAWFLYTTIREAYAVRYTREQELCQIAPEQNGQSHFELPVRLVDRQQCYAFLALGTDGSTSSRTVPVQYTTLAHIDGLPALVQVTTYERRCKAEAPEDDYLLHQAYELRVPMHATVRNESPQEGHQ